MLCKCLEEFEEMSEPEIGVGPHLPHLLNEQITFHDSSNLDF